MRGYRSVEALLRENLICIVLFERLGCCLSKAGLETSTRYTVIFKLDDTLHTLIVLGDVMWQLTSVQLSCGVQFVRKLRAAGKQLEAVST